MTNFNIKNLFISKKELKKDIENLKIELDNVKKSYKQLLERVISLENSKNDTIEQFNKLKEIYDVLNDRLSGLEKYNQEMLEKFNGIYNSAFGDDELDEDKKAELERKQERALSAFDDVYGNW